jgi:hypothetical protein
MKIQIKLAGISEGLYFLKRQDKSGLLNILNSEFTKEDGS